MTFYYRAELLPPLAVRLLARHPSAAVLTDKEIAEGSGLSPFRVFIISQQETWDGIDLPTMRKFLVGCRVNFCDWRQMNRIDAYLNSKPKWRHLRDSPLWQSYYEPILLRYLSMSKSIQAKLTQLNAEK